MMSSKDEQNINRVLYRNHTESVGRPTKHNCYTYHFYKHTYYSYILLYTDMLHSEAGSKNVTNL